MMRKLAWAAILSFLFLLLSFLNASQIVENAAEYSFSVEKLKTKLYDFSINASIDRWAYRRDASLLPPPYGVPNREFNSRQYQRISYSDGTYQSDIARNNRSACHRFVFTIYENKSRIRNIRVLWRGAGIYSFWGYINISSGSGAKLYAWNYSSSNYDEIANTTSYNVVNLSANLSMDYVGNDGKIIMVAEQISKTWSRWILNFYSVIATDYVSVEVEYA